MSLEHESGEDSEVLAAAAAAAARAFCFLSLRICLAGLVGFLTTVPDERISYAVGPKPAPGFKHTIAVGSSVQQRENHGSWFVCRVEGIV